MFGNQRLEARLDRIERKLDAILRHLEITDVPVPQRLPIDRPVPGSGSGMAEVDQLLAQGKKIQAIKRFRELYPGVSLKDAKDAVEAREKPYY
jgi:hypothetical protein